MTITGGMRVIADELHGVTGGLDETACERLFDMIFGAKRVFVAGAGRSGLMMRAFAMRLMHLGLCSYVMGETVTPGIAAADLLIIGSGSGETPSLKAAAFRTKSVGAHLALLTTRPDSSIGRIADVTAIFPAPTPKADSAHASVQPMGSLFEQSLLLFADALTLCLMERLSADSDAMMGHHANLE